MPSGLVTRTASSSVLRRLAPWAVVVLIGALLLGILPSRPGADRAPAPPTRSRSAPTASSPAPTPPSQSLWYKFNYIGGGQTVTATLTFEPADSTRLDLFFFTGDPSNPSQVTSSTSTLNGNIAHHHLHRPRRRRGSCSSKSKTTTPIARSASSATLTPTSTLATPTPTSASQPGHAPGHADRRPGGRHRRQRHPRRRQQRPVLGHARPRPGGLVPRLLRQPRRGYHRQHLGRAERRQHRSEHLHRHRPRTTSARPSRVAARCATATRSRATSMPPTPQFVFFSLANNSGGSVLAYGGNADAVRRAAGRRATPTASGTGTPAPRLTPAVTATATPVVQPAPAVAARRPVLPADGLPRGRPGRVVLPVARRGRHLWLPDLAPVHVPGLPGADVPAPDHPVVPGSGPGADQSARSGHLPVHARQRQRVPVAGRPAQSSRRRPSARPSTPTSCRSSRPNTPDQFNGQPVNFWQTFMARGGLEVLGAPISQPQVDPSQQQLHLHALPAGDPALHPSPAIGDHRAAAAGRLSEADHARPNRAEPAAGPAAASQRQSLLRPVLPRRHALDCVARTLWQVLTSPSPSSRAEPLDAGVSS